WIPMSDGVRLAARIWLPAGAERDPVPAILEYIPYRKRDFEAVGDSITHPYLAGHGYACIRVDLRGSGDSEGVLRDEYLQQELDDGLEVVRWIAEQPWCSGSVGMMGISWGGFNALQIAALQPPELKAIITLCSTDDRYADDVHHMGGCLLGDNLSWASVMLAFNSCPPDPALVGERWREMWFERLEGGGLWLEKWLRHQRRDAYWKHGSVCEDYAAIRCPVMAVSGWADGYSNAVFRLLANLEVPRKGLIGPWSHKYPHLGVPGPAIGFLQEALRWWDHWLKGCDRGLMEEPMLRVWMQESVSPTAHYETRPGRWVAEAEWPSRRIDIRTYRLGSWRLVPDGGGREEIPLSIQSPLSVGLFAGKWCSYAAPPDLPHDQREEDGGALIFETEPLAEPTEILGAAVAELSLSSNRPVAMVAVRLSDVAPDDKATRV
ncbi:MAG: CocE/NonD family hydrolase, partial [Gammaproteobacteria bacterium]|nr:CocE/NonD family hydrolase [Candidatus Kutchimonas denitrificans]NIR98695.1 CocE/NonD family hydrolase [Gammaproteobacteria bacterium]NIT64410.1 CocE/NonD family hydrolase [Gammaproteobacteria bacterium]NIV21335.1 CocE/NonD family hydrolase [Gammaproteobacteria bacterium]NIY32990.1 CocE/NonD family hydrolase [Gammaproteobacteria bacterium]